MRARVLITIAVPVVLAAVFARLGVWQLRRLDERRTWNRVLEERLRLPPVPVDRLGRDSAIGHYRRVLARGVFVWDREITWAARARQGSPGVNLLTPLRISGTDTVLMVDRGWVYSGNAKDVEHARWREGDSASISGYVETWSQPCPELESADLTGRRATQAIGRLVATCGESAGLVMRRLNRSVAEALTGLPVSPFVLIQTSDSALRADSVPARVGTPVLDEGPHRNYAIQWFSFAFIALAGGALFVRLRYLPNNG